MSQDRDYRRAFPNAAMNPWVPLALVRQLTGRKVSKTRKIGIQHLEKTL